MLKNISFHSPNSHTKAPDVAFGREFLIEYALGRVPLEWPDAEVLAVRGTKRKRKKKKKIRYFSRKAEGKGF